MEIKAYHELDKDELYRILQLRAEVFVTEQQSAYLDPDGKDRFAWHLVLRKNGHIAGYARIFPPGRYFPGAASIGRVVVDKNFRGKGFGYALMHKALDFLSEQFPESPVVISAQTYLIPFYQKLGFAQVSNEYLEDGIPHVRMIKEN